MGLGDLGRGTRDAETRGRGTRRRWTQGRGTRGLGDSGTRGLGDAWILGNVMNKPYFWAEFVKYDYKHREENTVTYQESPP